MRTVRRTLTMSVLGAAALAATAMTGADAHAQSGYAPPPPPPGFEGQVAPAAPVPQGYYVPMAAPPAAGPRRITDWEPGEPIPPGYHPITRVRTGLVIGGSVTFGVIYVLNVMVAAIAHDVGTSKLTPLYVPIAGPFIQMGTTSSAIGNFWLVLDGLAQAGGVAMLIAGIAAPKTLLVRNDLAKQKKLELMPTPMTFGSNSAGFGLVGKF